MYYRVAGFKRNPDCKEMIIRASSKEEAKKQFPAAKAFLFPGEDPDKCWCTVYEMPIKVNLGTTIPHYCISVYRMKEKRPNGPDEWEDLGGGEWEMILSADSPEDAKAKGAEAVLRDRDNPDDYEIYADEMTIEECIREEERHIRNTAERVFMELLKEKYMTIKEYSDYRRGFDSENNPEQRYEVLKTFNRFSRIFRRAIQTCDKNVCSVGKLLDVTEQLYRCEDEEVFRKLLDTLKSNSDKKERSE
ncbi:hypothetical protein IKP13_08135 [bacterium]|nr:hypothetical protein [bacterium]